MKHLIIFQNRKKAGSAELLDRIRQLLEKSFCILTADNTDDARRLMSQGADAAICLGGDGTILAIAEEAAGNDIPILGVNLGHLGYMSGLEADEAQLLEALANDDFETEKRFMLKACIIKNGVMAKEFHALNEITVCRGSVSKMIQLNLRCNGSDVAAYRADGLIASTPTGSTAYALSAGGPIIDPALSLISVCPVCPHTFAGARSLVFSPESKLEISVSSLYDSEIFLSADGKTSCRVCPGDTVTVTGSDRYIRFIKLKQNAFYQTLYKKFKDGV